MSENIKLGMYDVNTVLNDGGAITASKAGYVDSAAQIIDLGATRMDAKAIVNVTTAGTGATEKQVLTMQVSDSATFTGDIYNVGILELGGTTALVGDTAVGAGQYEIPFNNVIDGTIKRYARIYATITVVSPVSSLNYTAHLVPSE